MLPQKICFVDLETTGGSSRFDRVIEIGMVLVENGIITKEFQSLINPEKYIPPEIERLTGISGQDVIEAPLFYQIKDHILDTLADAVFVAHNVRFDYGFLKSEFARVNLPFSPKHFCTVKLSRLLYPMASHHNLDAVMERCNISCENRHRAFDDAKVLHEFFQHVRNQFPEAVIEQAVQTVMKKPSLPTKLPQADLDALPESPGVYLFYGPEPTLMGKDANAAPHIKEQTTMPFKELVPLYIGKSINLKERVLSHFAADIRSSTEMKIAQQIEHIETIETAGELGALLTESALIKKMLPIYNKMLRRKKQLMAIKHEINEHGYETAYIEPVDTIDPDALSIYLGFFRSRRDAKAFLTNISQEHKLCEKLLCLEKTSSSCFGYRLERCKGACVEKELPEAYNMRFVQAFSKMKVKPWPFMGPVVIEEKNDWSGKSDYFLMNNWCYLGSVTYDDQGISKKSAMSTLTFDLDIYKILLRYMQSPKNIKSIKTLTTEQAAELQQDIHLGMSAII